MTMCIFRFAAWLLSLFLSVLLWMSNVVSWAAMTCRLVRRVLSWVVLSRVVLR